MNIEEAREYCLSLKNVTECFPFDDVSLVFKVEGKMLGILTRNTGTPSTLTGICRTARSSTGSIILIAR